MSRIASISTVLAVACLLAACSTTDASLSYRSTRYALGTASLPMPAPTVASVTPHDQRKESPRRLGTIMGGYGNPLKILNTVRPVGDEVAEVFRQALARRGLLAASGDAAYRITVVIRKFDSDQYMGMGARTDMDMLVYDRAGQVVYQDTVQTSRSEARLLQVGIFSSIEDMQQMAQGVLDEAVDRLLDKPAFRAAVQGGASARVS